MKINLFKLSLFITLFILCGCNIEEIEDEAANIKIVDEELAHSEKVNEEIIDSTENKLEHLPEETKRELKYFIEKNYTVTPLDEFGERNIILLTIDDAPNKYSVEMARVLKELGASAIFFVNGHFINNPKGAKDLKTIYDLGFEIGNHTMTHPNLKTLPEAEQLEEIVKLNDLIEEITGERPRFFRAPFGVNTDVSKKIIAQENMQGMNWTYGYDFVREYMNKEALEKIMLETDLLIPGANLLMHDHKWTLEALPGIVEGLRKKGYIIIDPREIQ